MRTAGYRGLAALCVALAGTAGVEAQPLNDRLEGLLSISRVGDAEIGISIVDLGTGDVLADRGGTTPLVPASNMKLLTTGTAYLVLGPDFVFRTEVAIDGDRLIVRGSGDPALADPALLERMAPPLTVRALVDSLAGAVAAAGITAVSEVIVDDRIFDREWIHPGWPADQLVNRYCAQVSGLNFHLNVLSIFAAPAPQGVGGAPVITLEPGAWWLELEMKARTVPGREVGVSVRRDPGTNRFTVLGDVGDRAQVDATVHDPAGLCAQVLVEALLRAGVRVGEAPASRAGAPPSRADLAAAIRAVRTPPVTEAVPAGRSIAVVTTTLEDIVARCNTDSQNLYAESLLKRVGHEVTGEPGSWTNGASVVRMTLTQALGPEHAASTVVSDGSGLSRDNRVSAETLTAWLGHIARDRRCGDAFVASLAGTGQGTLRRRFGPGDLRNELRAKSGLLDGVRCLSGYLTEPGSGRRVAFSVLINGLKGGDAPLAAGEYYKAVVIAVDQWLTARTRAQPVAAESGG